MEDLIDSFIRFLAVERGLSENYQLSTHRSLSEFAQWCAARKKITRPRGVTLPVMSEYLAERKRAGLSASSIKLIVVALKIFFRFLAAKAIIDRDPSEALALPRIERYLPETLNELQVEQFLEKIDTKANHGLRDRAMIELLYASGLRISELANARLENFNFEERMIRVTGHSGAAVAGKSELEAEERRWIFIPSHPWTAGAHHLVVATTIEDLAGNNIGKPFEVDLFEAVQRHLTNSSVSIPFDVR